MLRGDFLKTGDESLDREINDAILQAREIYKDKNFFWRQKVLLKALFKAVIGFRVSGRMCLEKQKMRYDKKVGYFYDLLIKTGIQEKEIVGLIKKVRKRFTNGRGY